MAGFVDQVLEVGAGEAWRTRGLSGQVKVGSSRYLTQMNFEDCLAGLAVWKLQGDMAVEAAWTQQGRVEDIRPVGGGQDHHRLMSGEAVHL